MKLPVANQPWAVRALATAATCAVVALWGGGPAHAQSTGITPARQHTPPASASAAPAAGNRSGSATSLVNQVQMLKQQNRELLGQIEQLRHQLDRLKQINKEQYILLDTRIKQLEGGGKAAPSQSGDADGQAPAQAGSAAAAASAPEPASAATAQVPASAGSSAAATGSEEAQKAYGIAFDALRAGDFVKSSRGFRAFIQQYPHDKLTPNAWYWLGESYYITQNYKQAMDAFDTVLERFPQSGKAPGALLKKGYCQHALKQTDKAQATLEAVIAKYPGSSVAKLARQRLEDIRLQQQLH